MNYLNDLKQQLPLLGHRNWILVVDKAYPLQSSEGIRYMDADEELPMVLESVLHILKSADHVRPIVYTDKELSVMTDDLSAGVESLKQKMSALFEGFDHRELLHDEVFAKLDQASKLFNVLVVKTNSLIPYTSVFIELDCGYWVPEKEKALRERLS